MPINNRRIGKFLVSTQITRSKKNTGDIKGHEMLHEFKVFKNVKIS
jgi:hypothetical protein